MAKIIPVPKPDAAAMETALLEGRLDDLLDMVEAFADDMEAALDQMNDDDDVAVFVPPDRVIN